MPDLTIMSRAETEIARATGKAKGLTKFYGRPCKQRGHTERYVSDGACVACHVESNRRRYAENSESILKQKCEYKKENPDKINALAAKRRAAKAQATPPWSLYGYHRDRIDDYYSDSALFKLAFGLPFEVDHQISLFNGGLHVYWNLQHLIQSTNASKGTQDDAYVYPEPTFERITYRYNKGKVAL